MNLVVMSLWLVLVGAPADGNPSTTPEASVKALFAEQVAAWNRGDIPAFCAGYAEDAVFATPADFSRGRANLIERYKKHYPDRSAMGTLQLDYLDTRIFPAAGRAESVSVVARWTLTYPQKAAKSGFTLLVLRPQGNRWEIVQDASM